MALRRGVLREERLAGRRDAWMVCLSAAMREEQMAESMAGRRGTLASMTAVLMGMMVD